MATPLRYTLILLLWAIMAGVYLPLAPAAFSLITPALSTRHWLALFSDPQLPQALLATLVSVSLAAGGALIIALLAVLSILTLAVFAVRACRAGRSSFYVIAACAATSMMVFQTCLNVFGAVDILPLTGVTFPFVSNGGTAMIASWGLLAFLKATDTRQNASFAIRLPSRREDRRGAALAPKSTDEWEADDEED